MLSVERSIFVPHISLGKSEVIIGCCIVVICIAITLTYYILFNTFYFSFIFIYVYCCFCFPTRAIENYGIVSFWPSVYFRFLDTQLEMVMFLEQTKFISN